MHHLKLIAVITASLLLGACADEGPAERAGETIDEAAEDAGEEMEDAADEVDQRTHRRPRSHDHDIIRHYA